MPLPSIRYRPSQAFPADRIRDWRLYSSKLEQAALVKKYLEAYVKYWIENSPNPLEIALVESILNSKHLAATESLARIEALGGSAMVQAALIELTGMTDPIAINAKLESLSGEFFVLTQLTGKNSSQLERGTKYFDWRVGEKFVSVKAKERESSVFDAIYSILSANYSIANDNPVSRFKTIGVHGKSDYLTYSIKNRLYEFTRSELPNILRDVLARSEEIEFEDFTPDSERSWSGCVNTEYGELCIHLEGEAANPFNITYTFGDLDEIDRFIGCGHATTGHFVGAPKINRQWLHNYVSDQIRKFRRAWVGLGEPHDFLGWIVIPTERKYTAEGKLNGYEDVKGELQKIAAGHEFAVRVDLVPDFLPSAFTFEFQRTAVRGLSN